MAADSEDESLRKYKQALLGAAASGDLGDTSDPRKLVVTEFRVIFEDIAVADAIFDLSSEVFRLCRCSRSAYGAIALIS